MSKNIKISKKITEKESGLYDKTQYDEVKTKYTNIRKLIADEIETDVDIDGNDLSTQEIIKLAEAHLTPGNPTGIKPKKLVQVPRRFSSD